jgi:dipeptidyl aminopeptidase/acylaminoacyl peptidase
MAKRLKERKDSKVSARTWDKAPIRYWDTFHDDREAHLYTIGVEGGEPAAVTVGTKLQLSRSGAGTGSYDIAPDGKEIAFAADTDTTGVDPNFDVYLIPAAGGEAKNITAENKADDESPLYSPDGRWLAFERQVIGASTPTRLGWCCTTGAPARTGDDRRWTAGERIVWTRQQALYAIDDAAYGRVIASTPPPASGAGDQGQKLSTRPRPTVVLALRQSFSEPPTLVRVDTAPAPPPSFHFQ